MLQFFPAGEPPAKQVKTTGHTASYRDLVNGIGKRCDLLCCFGRHRGFLPKSILRNLLWGIRGGIRRGSESEKQTCTERNEEEENFCGETSVTVEEVIADHLRSGFGLER